MAPEPKLNHAEYVDDSTRLFVGSASQLEQRRDTIFSRLELPQLRCNIE